MQMCMHMPFTYVYGHVKRKRCQGQHRESLRRSSLNKSNKRGPGICLRTGRFRDLGFRVLGFGRRTRWGPKWVTLPDYHSPPRHDRKKQRETVLV